MRKVYPKVGDDVGKGGSKNHFKFRNVPMLSPECDFFTGVRTLLSI